MIQRTQLSINNAGITKHWNCHIEPIRSKKCWPSNIPFWKRRAPACQISANTVGSPNLPRRCCMTNSWDTCMFTQRALTKKDRKLSTHSNIQYIQWQKRYLQNCNVSSFYSHQKYGHSEYAVYPSIFGPTSAAPLHAVNTCSSGNGQRTIQRTTHQFINCRTGMHEGMCFKWP